MSQSQDPSTLAHYTAPTPEKSDGGGPAFPGFAYTDGRGNCKRSADGEWETYAPGMTLLDWLAGQIVSEGAYTAQGAYQRAAEMLVERRKYLATVS